MGEPLGQGVSSWAAMASEPAIPTVHPQRQARTTATSSTAWPWPIIGRRSDRRTSAARSGKSSGGVSESWDANRWLYTGKAKDRIGEWDAKSSVTRVSWDAIASHPWDAGTRLSTGLASRPWDARTNRATMTRGKNDHVVDARVNVGGDVAGRRRFGHTGPVRQGPNARL